MLIDRNGQAKILSWKEIEALFSYGFRRARDLALHGLCFYTACRISEARQTIYSDVFDSANQVRSKIVLPWYNTKGKRDTRVIPTHASLREILELYYQHSRHLLKLKHLVGDWTHKTLDSQGQLSVFNNLRCPRCESTWIHKSGKNQGEQRFLCRRCNSLSRASKMMVISSDLPFDSTQTYPIYGVKSSLNYGFLFENPDNPYLFPGYKGRGCLSLRTACAVFDEACDDLNIEGAGTHSWRRTALTMMHNANTTLRVIQEISGHRDLNILQLYLEVQDAQLTEAIAQL